MSFSSFPFERHRRRASLCTFGRASSRESSRTLCARQLIDFRQRRTKHETQIDAFLLLLLCHMRAIAELSFPTTSVRAFSLTFRASLSRIDLHFKEAESNLNFKASSAIWQCVCSDACFCHNYRVSRVCFCDLFIIL